MVVIHVLMDARNNAPINADKLQARLRGDGFPVTDNRGRSGGKKTRNSPWYAISRRLRISFGATSPWKIEHCFRTRLEIDLPAFCASFMFFFFLITPSQKPYIVRSFALSEPLREIVCIYFCKVHTSTTG